MQYPAVYAITDDGRCWSWGQNDNGQLGNGTTTDERTTPVEMTAQTGSGLENKSKLSPGHIITISVKSILSRASIVLLALSKRFEPSGTFIMGTLILYLNFNDLIIDSKGCLVSQGFILLSDLDNLYKKAGRVQQEL